MSIGKLLLTSSGITNGSIRTALVELLGKPIAEASALYIPTAIYAYPYGTVAAWQGIKAASELGWKSFGLLELTALPSLPRESWLARIEEVDAIMIGGGNKFYLSYWLTQTGLFDRLPRLIQQGKIYIGMSAGSMMLTPSLNYDRDRLRQTGVYHDDEFDETMPSSAGSAKTLGLVDFVIRPHFQADYFPQMTLANVEKWAVRAEDPLYALDDQSALKIIDGNLTVISEGEWKLFGKP